MAKRKKKEFNKNLRQKRDYKSKIIIAAEGKKTEVEYFECIRGYTDYIIEIMNRKTGKSSPSKVLEDLKKHLRNNRLFKQDDAWIIIDVDQWPQDQIETIFEFVKSNKKCHCAFSNPKFEYWLLLHFEDPKKSLSGNECTYALRKHLPDYKKGFPASRISKENLKTAIHNAKKRHHSDEYHYPKNNGSTVYLLVEKII